MLVMWHCSHFCLVSVEGRGGSGGKGRVMCVDALVGGGGGHLSS